MLPNPYPLQPYANHPAVAPMPQQSLGNSLLYHALTCGNESEGPAMIDVALKLGAQLNSPGCYDCNALVIAAQSNKPWAISILMQRGAEIPVAPSDGFDLLMGACRDGNLEMVAALTDMAKMDIHAFDCCGKTPLHHAALAGSDDVATFLLEHGAEADAVSVCLNGDEFERLFGHGMSLHGIEVTPLMIAVAAGNETLATTLLDAGADPNAGGCTPLIIAARRDHGALFDTLLAWGAHLNHCHGPHDSKGLAACIESRVPVGYLTKLLSQHDFSDDTGTVYSPLGYAIELNDIDTIALLLAANAPVEDHLQSDEPLTLWDLVLRGEKFSSLACDMLTARSPRIIDTDNPGRVIALLQELVKHCDNPARLASTGIFTSLLFGARENLTKLKQQSAGMTATQCALEAARILSGSFRARAHGTAAQVQQDESASVKTHQYWLQRTAQQIIEQKIRLPDACAKLIEHGIGELKKSTSLQFFLDCASDCPDDQTMAEFIKRRIADNSGAPYPVVRLVRNAWINAAKWTKDWQVAPQSHEDGNRFLLALAQNLISKGLDEFDADANGLVPQCLAALRDALAPESHPLGQFCANPVTWLQQLDNHHSLADPGPALPYRLQIELGLPRATCDAIASDWQRSLQAARTANQRTPEQLQAFLNQQVAASISDALSSDGGDKIIPPMAKAMLQNWRTAVLSTPPADQRTRKRPAKAEAPEAPPAKEARTT